MSERTKDHTIRIALEWETVVWTIALKENQLKTFFVDFDQQGKWIGRKLFTALEEEVARRWYSSLWLTSSTWWEKIYQKLGFVSQEKIEKERLGFGYIDIRMEKSY
jgi:GNAT superfamily N-acetyltransferase